MGSCASKQNPREKQKDPVISAAAQNATPLNLDVKENDRMVKRTFTVILSNVKIKSPPQKWKQQTEFEYTVDDYRLKTMAHMKLSLQNNSDIDLGTLTTKLHQVATGPYHHDMAVFWKSQLTPQKIAHMKQLNIPIKENLEGRMSFDLKMFQKIEFCITADEITGYLDHFTDKAYNFSFRLITHNNNYNSEHSENFLNPAFQNKGKRNNDQNQDINSQDEKSSRSSQKNKLGIRTNQDQEVDSTIDENFNNNMEENVEAIKIQSKIVKHNHVSSSHNLDGHAPAGAPSTNVRFKDSRQSMISEAKRGSTVIRKHTKKVTVVKHDGGDHTPTHSQASLLAAASNDVTDIIEGDETNDDELASQEKEVHELKWDYKNQDDDDGADPPELIVKLTTRDLATTSLQICFWGLHSTEALEKTDEAGNTIKYMDNHIAGECYVSLNRIFALQPEIIETKGQKVQVRKKVVQEKLWNHGKEVGTTISHFKVINHEYLQQMIVGVQTENGVLKASPAVYNFKENTSASNVDVKLKICWEEIIAKNTLNDSVFTLYEEKSVVNQAEKEKVQEAIRQSFNTIFSIAQKSDKESIKSFYYKSQEDLLQSQDILIDIAKQLLQYADDVEDSLRDNFYNCLKIIINRGEFDLNYMGFDDSYISLLDNAQGAHIKKNNFNKENLKKLNLKMKVALSYQKLLFNVLEKVLDKLNQKALSDKERQFVENYLAVAYFRIPAFRNKLLSVIARPDDIEITEWRGTEYQLDETKNQKLAKNNEFISLFDWDFGFYRFLQTQERGEQHFNELNAVLNDTKWSQRLSKRGVAFFFFLTEWLQYVNKTVVVKDHVPWQDLPGYLTLLRVFLIELKTRDVLEYPEAMKLSSSNFLNNERLLNILITLLFNKTNVYDSAKTVSTLDLINSWLKFLQQNNKNIPTVFDFNFFFKGIRVVLEQDHSVCLSRVIWLLYNNFALFPHDFQREICEYLFSNLFFKLFLHWSFNVRMIFQYFLMYRIHHLYQEQKTKYKNIDDLKRQLNNNTNQSDRKFALIHDLIIMLNSRMMNIIEIARKKYSFQESRRQQEKQFHLKMRNKLLEKQQQKFLQSMSSRHGSSQQSILEISFTQENQRFQEESKASKNILDDLSESTDRNQGRGQTQMSEKDMLLDSFENFEIEQIQRAQSTISQIKVHIKRGNSATDTPQIIQQEDNNYDMISADEENQNGSGQDDKGEADDQPKNQVVIYNRKMGYQVEKNDEELIQMEKQYLKYIAQACVEFEIIKQDYEKWLTQKLSQLPSMTKEKKNLHMRKFAIPEVILKATLDEAEASFSQVDEW